MNTDKALNIGLIGCGNVVVYGHRPALTSLPQLQLIALADITPQRRKLGAEWFSLREDQLYADYRDLLAIEALDAVVVAVPQQFRPPIVLDALATGLHVLSEKPIANTPTLAQRLVGAAADAGRVLAMVHNYHFLPEYKLIKQLLAAGEIGATRVAMLHFLGVIDYPGAAEYQSDWRHSLAAGGGVLMDMIHAVYLAEWLLGAPAQQVMAFIDAPEYAARQPVIEDLALLQIAFPRGYAAIHMGWGEGLGGVDISGADGHLRMRYKQHQSGGFNQPIELYSVDSDWNRHDHALPNLPTHADNIARSFRDLWADFAAAIREGRQPIAPAAAGARALEIVLGAYESAVTGRAVSLPLAESSPLYAKGVDGIVELEAWEESKTVAAGLYGMKKR
ncbi:MAG: Gfo/Idh/MocA family oxidoreductase [Chloroflexi bacterium]|nr:Gfo/Idh/MocA family oxidoreductase [Chloroflexota bacterium]MCY3582500.1 Gfo/Idh/MocA family oxidoreductase [Chloroflexota bacterium]MCY3714918.1 Gfo/Idh/MocA family oxidoreductase [Chloroflexota bacterium]MDE2650057.1 Gfo/Idh/MocA family oxidoreductase [Chloroflexota bacterium]MXV94033.1 Gfo/Idh/MocA family oxidoreductase [Chloroflexota bacterium]